MAIELFGTLESAEAGDTQALADILDALRYNDQGLIPAIAQDAASLEVLMLGWMNRTSIERTLTEGFACYWSRSRQTYWRKGESSGHLQALKAMRFDCDGDTILLLVDQSGPACHTNRNNCFYLEVDGAQVRVTSEPV